MKYHLYRNRHVFHDDEFLGKFDPVNRIVRLRAECADHKDQVRAFFMRTRGQVVRILVGEEALVEEKPLVEFPDEVRSLFDPAKGDLSKEAIEYALENFSADEFSRRYGGRLEEKFLQKVSHAPVEEKPDEEIAAIADKGPEYPTMPIKDSMSRDQIKHELKHRGIKFDGRDSTENLRALL